MLHGGLSGSFPPVGTSAYKAFQYQQRTGQSPTIPPSLSNKFSRLPSIYDSAKSLASKALSRPFGGSSGGFSAPAAPAASPGLDYYQAALAGHYGMDASTAYQEALANTSYQRSVQDMLNAGLNPASLFAAGRVSGANGVNYATQLGSGFVDSGSGAGSARGKYVFSKGMYNALQGIGGTMAVAVTKHPASYFPGAAATKGVLNAINGFLR